MVFYQLMIITSVFQVNFECSTVTNYYYCYYCAVFKIFDDSSDNVWGILRSSTCTVHLILWFWPESLRIIVFHCCTDSFGLHLISRTSSELSGVFWFILNNTHSIVLFCWFQSSYSYLHIKIKRKIVSNLSFMTTLLHDSINAHAKRININKFQHIVYIVLIPYY